MATSKKCITNLKYLNQLKKKGLIDFSIKFGICVLPTHMQPFVKSKLKKKFLNEGYCIFNIDDDKLVDKINIDIDNLIKKKKFKINSKIYSYNKSLELLKVTNFQEVAKYYQKIQR